MSHLAKTVANFFLLEKREMLQIYENNLTVHLGQRPAPIEYANLNQVLKKSAACHQQVEPRAAAYIVRVRYFSCSGHSPLTSAMPECEAIVICEAAVFYTAAARTGETPTAWANPHGVGADVAADKKSIQPADERTDERMKKSPP